MSTADISKVLSSGSRLRILNALSTGPKDVRGIVREVKIQPTAIRYHLQSLLRLGLIDSYEEKGGVGRPRVFYRLAKKQVTVGFPPRHYPLLSEIFLNALQKLPDQERVKAILRKVSGDFGKSVLKDLGLRYQVSEWTPSQFDKYFIKILLPELGAQAETIKLGSREVLFRNYTCPFEEMAIKYPAIICDILHEGWLDGVGDVIDPRVKTKRLKCIGHGDEYCENFVEWPA